ncbi:MAG: hypothetical protein K8T20_18665 [Planctomycetes bacterium]|nr:hypothetical protein [Planctomycetota bacterium]
MPRFRIWDVLLGAALLAMLAHMILLVRQRSALEWAIEERVAEKAAPPPAAQEGADRGADLRKERDELARSLSELQARFSAVESEKAVLASRVAALESRSARGTNNEAIQGVLDELDVANDRLRKAYTDIEELEEQLVAVSRSKNEIEEQLAILRLQPLPPAPGDLAECPQIDGVILGVSDKVNLVLISVGNKDNVKVGYKFTVYRGSEYVSKLVVDKVEDTWAACRELLEFRKVDIQQGDSVSTHVFD